MFPEDQNLKKEIDKISQEIEYLEEKIVSLMNPSTKMAGAISASIKIEQLKCAIDEKIIKRAECYFMKKPR